MKFGILAEFECARVADDASTRPQMTTTASTRAGAAA
jgi:hypothetical protein